MLVNISCMSVLLPEQLRWCLLQDVCVYVINVSLSMLSTGSQDKKIILSVFNLLFNVCSASVLQSLPTHVEASGGPGSRFPVVLSRAATELTRACASGSTRNRT